MTLTPTVLREYDRGAPDSDDGERATFGLGCFWGPDADFGALDGVVRTRVGYAGGTKADPSYHALGDHTEVLQVDFDPDTLTYREIVDEIFRSHYPNKQTGNRQYHNVVLTANESQHETVLAVLRAKGYDDVVIRESPAAAKLNAHAGGRDVSLPFLDARTR